MTSARSGRSERSGSSATAGSSDTSSNVASPPASASSSARRSAGVMPGRTRPSRSIESSVGITFVESPPPTTGRRRGVAEERCERLARALRAAAGAACRRGGINNAAERELLVTGKLLRHRLEHESSHRRDVHGKPTRRDPREKLTELLARRAAHDASTRARRALAPSRGSGNAVSRRPGSERTSGRPATACSRRTRSGRGARR